MEKSLLLIFNAQNDFASLEGKLASLDCEEVTRNIINFINNNADNIHDLVLIQSSYQSFNIKFSSFWKTKVKPGDIITLGDFIRKEKVPVATPEEIDYEFMTEYFMKNGPITIQKEHCIEGTIGWAFPTKLMKAVNNWSVKNKRAYSIQKTGEIPVINYSSILADESIIEQKPFWRVVDYDVIYICGFYKDTIISKTVKDLISTGEYNNKLVFLESCMETMDSKSETLTTINDAVTYYGATVLEQK